jgi:hypothetical protein
MPRSSPRRRRAAAPPPPPSPAAPLLPCLLLKKTLISVAEALDPSALSRLDGPPRRDGLHALLLQLLAAPGAARGFARTLAAARPPLGEVQCRLVTNLVRHLLPEEGSCGVGQAEEAEEAEGAATAARVQPETTSPREKKGMEVGASEGRAKRALKEAGRPASAAMRAEWTPSEAKVSRVDAERSEGVPPAYSPGIMRLEYEARRWVRVGTEDFLNALPLPEASPLRLPPPRPPGSALQPEGPSSEGVWKARERSEAGRVDTERSEGVWADEGPLKKADAAAAFSLPRPSRMAPEDAFFPASPVSLLDCFADVTVVGPPLAAPWVVSRPLEDSHLPVRALAEELERSLGSASCLLRTSRPRPVLVLRFAPSCAAPAASAPAVWIEGMPLRRLCHYPGLAAAFALSSREDLLRLCRHVAAAREGLWLRFEGCGARAFVGMFVVV